MGAGATAMHAGAGTRSFRPAGRPVGTCIAPKVSVRTIASYMTKQPWSVQIDDSVIVAKHMMAERRIHHLPVLDGGRLVGMVTERDLVQGAARDTSNVEHVMGAAVEVDASMALADVLDTMVVRERDAVVITRNGAIEGIFTAMDAVRALRERLRVRHARTESAGATR